MECTAAHEAPAVFEADGSTRATRRRCEESEYSRETMEECAHACKAEGTHGYECNRTTHRCESVKESANKSLPLCEHECRPPTPPEHHGYVCNSTLKTCERSMESSHTITECE